jgi:hypothetical protein
MRRHDSFGPTESPFPPTNERFVDARTALLPFPPSTPVPARLRPNGRFLSRTRARHSRRVFALALPRLYFQADPPRVSAVAIDTYRPLAALKGTGKSANFTADEIAHAVDVAQEESSVLTKSDFAMAKADIDSRMAKFEARMDAFDAKLEALRLDIKAEVKSSQVQLLLWLSGIVLASNGIVIALLGRLAHIY